MPKWFEVKDDINSKTPPSERVGFYVIELSGAIKPTVITSPLAMLLTTTMQGSAAYWVTNDMIDLSNFKQLTGRLKTTKSIGHVNPYTGIFISTSKTPAVGVANFTAYAKVNSADIQTLTIDVSNLNGEYYVGFYTIGSAAAADGLNESYAYEMKLKS